ncbi:hypothetical protein FSZ31_03445 [Sphingorhabdus soli]|uniref:TonB C-terminal domain-containing protein n=1 Tax=Flavisphingopyxis soli TaxID=2601267 RepID=A0A5C6ULF5_9SPHN|nr:hypothetical protein [Sphingorhabdus soli]TXC73797.1 hypothetical protein FSZ31_03445 [Sphingorhabdus soli]
MRHSTFCFGLLITCFLSPSADAKNVVTQLAPTSKWVLDYDTTSCKLVRSFGEGDQTIVAQFNGYGLTNVFELRLLGRPLRIANARTVTLAFGNEISARKVKADIGRIGEKGLPLLFLGRQSLIPRSLSSDPGQDAEITPQQEAAIDSLTLTLPNHDVYRLQTGPMAQPMAAMRTCLDDLVRSWGLEPSELKHVKTDAKPIGSPGGWLGPDDYPSGLNDEDSNVAFVLVVNKVGEVENCYVQSVTNDPKFGSTVCEKLRKRARFHPALDESGQAVRSLYRNRVSWRVIG